MNSKRSMMERRRRKVTVSSSVLEWQLFPLTLRGADSQFSQLVNNQWIRPFLHVSSVLLLGRCD
jgi:hypothetical protein